MQPMAVIDHVVTTQGNSVKMHHEVRELHVRMTLRTLALASTMVAVNVSCTSEVITPSVSEESPIVTEFHVDGPAPKGGITPSDPALTQVRFGSSWCPDGIPPRGLSYGGPKKNGTMDVHLWCFDGTRVIVHIVWD
jgi:hypothetical protein